MRFALVLRFQKNPAQTDRYLKMLDFFRINEWQKLNLRVGQIVKVEDVKGADKLYKLRVDLGQELGERIVCAGLKEHYSKDELQGKKVIFFANLFNSPYCNCGIHT